MQLHLALKTNCEFRDVHLMSELERYTIFRFELV